MLATLLLSLAAFAGKVESPELDVGDDWKITFDGQIRPRLLWHSGKDFLEEGVEPASNITQRARLGTTIKRHHKGPSFTLRLQDVRAWGEESDTLFDYSADGLDAHEAFLRVPIGEGMAFRVGRQEIILDNHRLVGNVGWSPMGRSFDAVRFDRNGDSYSVTLFGSALSSDLKYLFGGLHLSFDVAEGHKVSAVALGRTLDPDTRHSVGAQATGQAGGFAYTVEGYYQLGEEAGDSVSAWMGGANVGYTVDNKLKPSIGARAEALSGDGTAQGTFDTLYATNHKFYGEMDWFLAIGPHTGFLGLMDIGGQVAIKPTKRTKLSVDLHHFTTMESDAEGETALGDEIDTKLVIKAGKGLSLDALYGIYVPGETMGNIRGYGDAALVTEHLFFFTTDFKI